MDANLNFFIEKFKPLVKDYAKGYTGKDPIVFVNSESLIEVEKEFIDYLPNEISLAVRNILKQSNFFIELVKNQKPEKPEYKIISRWKENFLKCGLVASIDNSIVNIDTEKCKLLFEGNQNTNSIIFPESYSQNLKLYIEGCNSNISRAKKILNFLPFYNYIGIDFNAMTLNNLALADKIAANEFVYKGYYLFKELTKYKKYSVFKIYDNNFGDLMFLANIYLKYNFPSNTSHLMPF